VKVRLNTNEAPVPPPAAFVDELADFTPAEQERIMRANTAALIGLA
jgi:hypothetical protein